MKYLLSLLFFLFFSLSTFSQSVIYVSPNGDDNNDGSSSSPYKTITKALSIINSGTIKLLGGVYREKITIDNKSNIKISGDESGYAIIDGTVDLNDLAISDNLSTEKSPCVSIYRDSPSTPPRHVGIWTLRAN